LIKGRNTLLIASVIAASVSTALAADGDRVVYGAGMVTCGEWQRFRSTGNKPASLQLQAWIDGFLSGYNTASEDKDIIAPKPESIAYYAWIDNYCGQNPLNKVMQAVMALQSELAARAR
jgi:hypothetical protein